MKPAIWLAIAIVTVRVVQARRSKSHSRTPRPKRPHSRRSWARSVRRPSSAAYAPRRSTRSCPASASTAKPSRPIDRRPSSSTRTSLPAAREPAAHRARPSVDGRARRDDSARRRGLRRAAAVRRRDHRPREQLRHLPDHRAVVRRRRHARVRRPARRAVSPRAPRCARDRRQGLRHAGADEELVGRRARSAAIHADQRARHRRGSRRRRSHRSLERRARRRRFGRELLAARRAGAATRRGAARWRCRAAAKRRSRLRGATVSRRSRLPQLRKLGRVARAQRLASARCAPRRRRRPARARTSRRARRRRCRRRSRLARLPQFLLDHALQPGIPLRALGRACSPTRSLRRTDFAVLSSSRGTAGR